MIPAIPETAAAAAAADLASAAAPPYLLNHSYRTFLFGRCLVPAGDVDDEAAFVASMLHDLGLTDEHQTEKEFAHSGAELAVHFWNGAAGRSNESGSSRKRSCGTRIFSPKRSRSIVSYKQARPLSSAGLGSEEMDPESISAIVSAYPRLDFVEQMRSVFLDEARRHPDGVFADLERTVALSTRFGANPIDRAGVTTDRI